MKISENRELTRLMIDHMANLYGIREKREGIHLSTLIYCLKRQQMDAGEHTIVPTDEEVMLFAIGWGLQDVMTPKSAETPTLEKDGIIYRPDLFFALEDMLCEIKTTRMSAKKMNSHDFPVTWLKYMMGGCFITERNTYDLSVLCLMGYYNPPFPILQSYHFEFDDMELVDNWAWLQSRYTIYTEALASGEKLPPYIYADKFECKNCRYSMICTAEDSIRVLKLQEGK
jgi:hypothetical protein